MSPHYLVTEFSLLTSPDELFNSVASSDRTDFGVPLGIEIDLSELKFIPFSEYCQLVATDFRGDRLLYQLLNVIYRP